MSLDVLLATTDAREAAWLARCLGDAMPIIVATSDAELYARAETAAVIVVGATSGAAEADRLLGELAAGGVRAPILRIADPRRLAPDPRVAFVLSTAVEAPAVKLLIVSLAWRRPAAAASGARPLDIDEARRRERAFAATRRLAAAARSGAALRWPCCSMPTAQRARSSTRRPVRCGPPRVARPMTGAPTAAWLGGQRAPAARSSSNARLGIRAGIRRSMRLRSTATSRCWSSR